MYFFVILKVYLCYNNFCMSKWNGEFDNNKEEVLTNDTDHDVWGTTPNSENILIQSWENIPKKVTSILDPLQWN